MRRKASILVGVLWCLALLSVVVVGTLHTSRLDLMIVKNYGDVIQAHYLALAGIEKAKALLYQDASQRKRARQNHSGTLYDAPQYFRDIAFGRGQFRVFHPGQRDEGGGIVYGIRDEESRLNVNLASAEEIGKLERMTPDIVAAIIDWRDEDNQVTPGGAEAEYYLSLHPPYLPRNGPIQTVRELLMVRGVSPELLLGENARSRSRANQEDDTGGNAYLSEDRNGLSEAGWAGLMTVNSTVRNVNAAGEERVDIQSASESALTAVPGISTDIAKAIVAYRGRNRFENIAGLLDVVAVQNQGQPGQPGTPNPNPPGEDGSAPPANAPPVNAPDANPSGPKVISQELFIDLADNVTAQSDQEQPGLININTASAEVLACLAGIDQQLAEAIVAYRRSSGFFPNIAWLLKVPGINQQIFKQIAARVSARSETFRILSEGKIRSTGARQRIQVIVRLGAYDIETLSYQEDL